MGYDGVHKPGQDTEIEVQHGRFAETIELLKEGRFFISDEFEVRANEEGMTPTVEGNGVTVDWRNQCFLMIPQWANASLPPAAPMEGMIAYDTTNSKLVFSNGTAWETVTSSV